SWTTSGSPPLAKPTFVRWSTLGAGGASSSVAGVFMSFEQFMSEIPDAATVARQARDFQALTDTGLGTEEGVFVTEGDRGVADPHLMDEEDRVNIPLHDEHPDEI
ncbi:hypothetical protein Dimus_007806, partial [Dionaea muscipula]